ncbi:MAG TPA: membrane protein insertase YidC [Candidatus Aquabacterium excrementipullorum]|nr:membrane protein insertase YidC [Candidatus Aquabacterium excrementipullorum]
MNDMRRTILWSVFAFSLLMLWDGWLRHTGQPSMFSPAPAASVAEAASGATGQTPGATDAGSVPPAGATAANAANAAVPVAAAASGAAPATTAAPREQLVLTTDVLRATVDTQGGNIVKLELLKYTDQDHPEQKVLVLDPAHAYAAQSGLVSTAGTDLPNHISPMAAVTSERTLADGQDALVLKLESAPVNGVKRVLSYSFPRGGYVVGVKQEVVNTSGATVSPKVYVQLVRDNVVPHSTGFFGAPTAYTGPAFYTLNSKFKKVEFKHIDDSSAEFDKSADNGWVSMIQHYFAAAWLDTQATSREFFARKVGTNLYAVGMLFNLGDVAAGQSKAFESQLYLGPQEEKKLETIAPGLELVKDYGLVTILAKPLFWLLYYIHGVLQNWGWSIVALVVLLKAAFYWLNAKAYRSMAKMKAINPRIQDMRERLKDNPQQMQQEMLKIYREEKVNPIGGCLPIMIQIPVFIALYWVLLSSVEIRNAPWIGWIHDLSVKDPFYVLPLLMTASTMLQTWLNPTPPDPVQAKMMWIMPLVFSVMFFFFPAGLVLYWLTNNLLSIAQQWMINKQIEGGAKKA